MSASSSAAIDRFCVRETVEHYCDSLTRRDWPMMATLYAEDASWHEMPPIELRFTGRDAIVAGVSAATGNIHTLIMMIHSCIVAIDGDRASARSLIHEHGVAINGCDPISMYGLYEDDLVRAGDGWIFQNRVFRPIHWSLPGDFREQVAGKAV